MTRAFIAAQFLLLLAACAAAVPELDRRFLTGSEPRKGIVIFSTTHTGEYRNKLSGRLGFACDSGVKGSVDDHYAMAQYLDGEKPSIPVGNPTLAPANPMGRIHILELPAGNCVFNAYSAVANGMNVRTTLNTQPFSIRFSVPDGGVAYVGNYNMEWLPGAGRRSFNDFYERDLAALRKQNVALPGPVQKHLATPGRL